MTFESTWYDYVVIEVGGQYKSSFKFLPAVNPRHFRRSLQHHLRIPCISDTHPDIKPISVVFSSCMGIKTQWLLKLLNSDEQSQLMPLFWRDE